MADEWQLSSRELALSSECAPPKHNRPGLSRCADRRSPHLVCQASEIMGRPLSRERSYPSTDWVFVCHVNSPSRPLFLVASTVHHYVEGFPIAKEALYYPKKSLFCSSSAFIIHAGTTRQSGCPPTLAAHFPGSITAVEQLREPLACFLPILYSAPDFSICRHHEEEVFVQSDPDSKSLPPYSKAITNAHGTHKLTRRRRRPPNRRPRHTKARHQTGGGIALVLQPRLS